MATSMIINSASSGTSGVRPFVLVDGGKLLLLLFEPFSVCVLCMCGVVRACACTRGMNGDRWIDGLSRMDR